MNLTAEQLAELIAGIARAQTAVIDAVERANGGWRSAHALPLLTVAANVRAAEPRLIDLPSRVLLRMQGRGAVEISSIVADLQRLTSGAPAVAPTAAPAAAAAAPAAASPVAESPAAESPAAPQPAAAGGDMDFTAKG